MTRRPPSSTRTSTPFPYTTLFRSLEGGAADDQAAADLGDRLDLDQPVFLERAPRRDEIDDARREAQRRRQFHRTVQFDTFGLDAARLEEGARRVRIFGRDANVAPAARIVLLGDRKSTRLNSSH